MVIVADRASLVRYWRGMRSGVDGQATEYRRAAILGGWSGDMCEKDLISELRLVCAWCVTPCGRCRQLRIDAAAEIERLRAELAAERIWGETAQHRLAELYTLVQQVLDKIEKFRTHEEAEDFEAAGGRE